MARGKQKSQIQLDWATVSYRSIMRAVVYLVLLVALGGLFFYLKASLRMSPEDVAIREIERAAKLHQEASLAAGEAVLTPTERTMASMLPGSVSSWRRHARNVSPVRIRSARPRNLSGGT